MAIPTIDVKHIHTFSLPSDTQEPKTKFHSRTLTRTQRAHVSELLAPVFASVKSMAAGNKPDISEERLLELALQAFELLIVDIVQIGAAVPKEERAFGLAVPKEWADAHLGEAQIFEAVTEAFSANVLSQEQKKTSGDASSSATSPLPPTAADAGPAERPMQEDVSVAGTLSTQM